MSDLRSSEKSTVKTERFNRKVIGTIWKDADEFVTN